MEGSIKSVRKAFSGEEEDQTDILGQVKNYCGLSFKQRFIGFLISVGLAALFAILGCALAVVSLPLFAILFTVGTICGIVSTLFLVGPIAQGKKLCDTSNVTGCLVKIICIIVLFIMIVLVFCAVFWWKIAPLAVLFCIIEFAALVIYSITLIPFATCCLEEDRLSILYRMFTKLTIF